MIPDIDSHQYVSARIEGAAVFEPTMNLRWWRKASAISNVLQQLWIDRESGKNEWRDVPLVEEVRASLARERFLGWFYVQGGEKLGSARDFSLEFLEKFSFKEGEVLPWSFEDFSFGDKVILKSALEKGLEPRFTNEH